MALTLHYHAQTQVPVEIEGFTPDWAEKRTLSEIERFEIFHGNCRIPIAELFRVSGDASDRSLIFEGDLSGVHWIGAHMTRGIVRVHGSAGRHVGSQMRGGELTVDGNAAGWVGAEMRYGLIRIKGNAGHLTGAAYRGSSKGMTGGMIFVDGNAGDEVGLAMRRGVIAVRGSVGDIPGFNMIAGTVAVFGVCGSRPGAGMRRGTLALLGEKTPPLLPTFRYATTSQSTAMQLLLRTLNQNGFVTDNDLATEEFHLYHGDAVSVGRGELLLRASAVVG